MLLILTNSFDGTTDLLIRKLPVDAVFRLNCDLLESYKIEITQHGFFVEDGTGRRLSSDQVAKCYYRKPWIDPVVDLIEEEDKFRSHELRYAVAEMINIVWIQHKVALVEPYAERRCGKFIQLMTAKKHFVVPDWHFVYRSAMPSVDRPQIVKTLSGEQVSVGKVLYTTQVDPSQLDPDYPWFVQDYVEAKWDLTVVYCRGKLFAFTLDRSFAKDSSDWREFIGDNQRWSRYAMSDSLSSNIIRFMDDLGLHYGRLDFLLTNENEATFCEVNPNGQFAWLDLAGREGLLDAIVSEISPFTELHSIPYWTAGNSKMEA